MFVSSAISNARHFIQERCISGCDIKFAKIDDNSVHEAVVMWYMDKDKALEKYGHIENWDTSEVTCTARLFYGMSNFNDDISKWDMSHVIDMTDMFKDAHSFNQVNIVFPMSLMLAILTNVFTNFQDIGMWNLSKVTSTTGMFSGAVNFDQVVNISIYLH